MQINPYSPAYLNAAAELFAASLLDAALRDYAARGFRRMSVDYETINPEALAFWPRYFTPVAVSLVRVVEYV